jgi:hypothetical protein
MLVAVAAVTITIVASAARRTIDDAYAEACGIVRASMRIPRTVLEWRVDIGSPWHSTHLTGRDQRLILLSDHGDSSSGCLTAP